MCHTHARIITLHVNTTYAVVHARCTNELAFAVETLGLGEVGDMEYYRLLRPHVLHAEVEPQAVFRVVHVRADLQVVLELVQLLHGALEGGRKEGGTNAWEGGRGEPPREERM